MLRPSAATLNGAAVACGVAAVLALVGAVAGAHAAQLALSGAVCASLADTPNTPARTWQRVLAAGLLSLLAAVMAALLKTHPVALGVGTAAIAFAAMMTMAWGARAGAVSFAPILSLVFAMAVPPGRPLAELIGFNALGTLLYLGWAVLTSVLLQRRYRTRALAAALRATAELLRSRAALLEALPAQDGAAPAMRSWLQGEADLAEKLQTARDFVFAAAESPRVRRDTALLLHAIDLRDVLLASRLDLELLGRDAAGPWLLERVARALRGAAVALEGAAGALLGATLPALPSPGTLAALFDAPPMPPTALQQRLLPAIQDRLRLIAADVLRIDALLRGADEQPPLTRDELQRFVAPEGWPPQALRAQLSFESPVLRHALRAALALGAAYFIALALPWASHPHWLVLSVAVVLRGNLEQTLARRNARVLGTLLGCAIVLGLANVHSPPLLQWIFLAAVGTAHASVLRRYWVTAAAATVMALLQAHLMAPDGGFAIAERVADTLLGAALAWAFSYVLPSWERRQLPRAIGAVLKTLREFAALALAGSAVDAIEQRLARRRAYDALGALAAALQRSGAEPAAVQLPTRDVAALLDHGQRLMAHLSMVRLTLARRAAELGDTAPQLQQTAALLTRRLDLRATDVPDADAAALPPLPEESPAHNIRPWLERRLQLLRHDAARIREAARDALTKVRA